MAPETVLDLCFDLVLEDAAEDILDETVLGVLIDDHMISITVWRYYYVFRTEPLQLS